MSSVVIEPLIEMYRHAVYVAEQMGAKQLSSICLRLFSLSHEVSPNAD